MPAQTNQRRPRQARLAAPAGKTFRVSRDILRTLLRLAPDVTITGAEFDVDTSEIVFTIDVPRAPKNATGLTVRYSQIPGRDSIRAQPEWQYVEPEPTEPTLEDAA